MREEIDWTMVSGRSDKEARRRYKGGLVHRQDQVLDSKNVGPITLITIVEADKARFSRRCQR